jgi:hypothetical protein
MLLGCAGALDYAMHSAATLGKAADLARRYGGLFSDRLEVHCEIEGDRATLHVDVGSTARRPICDFAMSARFTNHVRESLSDVSGVECWFSYPEPRNRTEYERTFSPATLRFDARCCAFSFARERLDAPLATSDPLLHVLLCDHAESRARAGGNDLHRRARSSEMRARSPLHGRTRDGLPRNRAPTRLLPRRRVLSCVQAMDRTDATRVPPSVQTPE